MLWTKNDLKIYLAEKEYVDTVFIPLVPFDPASDKNMEKEAFQNEINQVFAHLLEKEFKGRILLSPSYHYLTGEQEKEVDRLNHWVDSYKKQPFEHVFLFTLDPKWKKYERQLEGQLLWIPGLGSGDLQSTETKSFIKEQAGQVSDLIQAYW
ncbi:DUF2487 family protein [Halobacillus sp. Marseille-Q1614]|uniref:DUF2487 family protein n=1 Tax=Halobacillus sp. Marseille-Q1614 TaxID=2709134 RepID=UPI00156F29E3|nr:DUF2487 family protein [Halobacillus sp. Marseille-Q1614]